MPRPAAEEDENEEDIEEGRNPCAAAIPASPTREEREKHMLTHIPFRPWCQHCISGKAKGNPHKKAGEHI